MADFLVLATANVDVAAIVHVEDEREFALLTLFGVD